jgi:hypothetical protein
MLHRIAGAKDDRVVSGCSQEALHSAGGNGWCDYFADNYALAGNGSMYLPRCDGNPCTDDRNTRHVALAPCEMRWSLLQEGPYAFLMILGLPG